MMNFLSTLTRFNCYPDPSKNENRNTKLGSAGRFAQRIPAGVCRIPTDSCRTPADVRRMSVGCPEDVCRMSSGRL